MENDKVLFLLKAMENDPEHFIFNEVYSDGERIFPEQKITSDQVKCLPIVFPDVKRNFQVTDDQIVIFDSTVDKDFGIEPRPWEWPVFADYGGETICPLDYLNEEEEEDWDEEYLEENTWENPTVSSFAG